MGNWNLDNAYNQVSDTPIEPPFLDELGPEGMATADIDLASNDLTGRVVHYSDRAMVDYSGDWRPREIIGFWDLFSFKILEADPGTLVEISCNMPIEDDGSYMLSMLYLPDEQNASNAIIKIISREGVSEKKMDMTEGDRFGFARQIGQYSFKKGDIARVIISNAGADGVVVANAVVFVKVNNN